MGSRKEMLVVHEGIECLHGLEREAELAAASGGGRPGLLEPGLCQAPTWLSVTLAMQLL